MVAFGLVEAFLEGGNRLSLRVGRGVGMVVRRLVGAFVVVGRFLLPLVGRLLSVAVHVGV